MRPPAPGGFQHEVDTAFAVLVDNKCPKESDVPQSVTRFGDTVDADKRLHASVSGGLVHGLDGHCYIARSWEDDFDDEGMLWSLTHGTSLRRSVRLKVGVLHEVPTEISFHKKTNCTPYLFLSFKI